MPGVDTNLLVRCLMDDDAIQTNQVKLLLATTARRQESLFVPLTVVLELEWVLRSRYALGKPDILLALNTLLEIRELEIQSEPAVERALHAYRMGNADFADCLHAGACWSAGKAPLLTLDAKAARLSDAELLRG